MAIPPRIFVDTNIFIIGSQISDSAEARILTWLGYWGDYPPAATVIISDILISELSRVGIRLRNKDWASILIDQVWRNLDYESVEINPVEFLTLQTNSLLPREDIGVDLTAKTGQAEYFISANYKLIRTLAVETQDFQCLTPEEFVTLHLSSDD
jgi:predicted nucleic acid-binding protein